MKQMHLLQSNSRAPLYLSALAIFLAFVILSPVIDSGFEGDDAHNSLVGFHMSLWNQNAFEFTYPIYKSWLKNTGRLFPLPWVYGYSAHSILSDVRLYKASLVVSVLLNMLAFGYFIKLMTQSIPLALLGLSLPPLFFQIRVSADPIRGFCWLQQLLFLYIILSFILLILYLKKKKRYLYVLSWVAYTLGLLTYETSYPFCLVHFFIVLYFSQEGSFTKCVKVALPFFLLSGACILTSILLRFHFNVPLSGGGGPYIPNYDAMVYLVTLAKEISAAFPLSYVLFNPHGICVGIFAYLKDHFSVHVITIALGYFILFMTILNYLSKDTLESEDGVSRKPLLVLGLLLLILPAVLIALSPKYQAWSGWGIGYLNVYLSYYGLVMVVIFLVDLIYGKITVVKRGVALPLSIILSTLMASVGVINYTTNSMVVAATNQNCLYPRETIEDAMKRGLFQDVPEDVRLLVNSCFVWDQLAFYWKHSGGRVKYVGVTGSFLKGIGVPLSESKGAKLTKGISKKLGELPERLYYLSYFGQSKENGYAILGKVSNILADEAEIYSAFSQKLYIYAEFADYSHAQFSLAGRWFDEKGSPEMSVPFTLHQDRWDRISSGRNWKLWSFESEDHWIDLKSLYLGEMLKKRGRSISFKANREHYLKTGKDTLFHEGFMLGGNGVSSAPLTLNDSFSVEVIVKPYEGQGNYAHIVGNHPGYKYFEGFTLQQDGSKQNVYTFGFGNGKTWLPSVRLHLVPDKRHYVAIVVEKNIISVYVNGFVVASADTGDSMKNSSMPLWIGNWVNRDRPFNGLIEEVRISNNALPRNEIESSWRSVKKTLR